MCQLNAKTLIPKLAVSFLFCMDAAVKPEMLMITGDLMTLPRLTNLSWFILNQHAGTTAGNTMTNTT